jgi:hypothetical protein
LALALGVEPVDARGQNEQQTEKFHKCIVFGPE